MLLALILIFVHSCVAKPITDLRVAETQRVPAASFPQEGGLRSAWMQRREMLWKVTLEGNADWIAQVRRHELNSYATVIRCDDRNVRVSAFGPYVGRVRISNYEDGIDGVGAEADTLRYDIYFPEAAEYRSQADPNASMPPYDLSRERLRLCVTIAGGAMHGAFARSNEVEVDLGSPR